MIRGSSKLPDMSNDKNHLYHPDTPPQRVEAAAAVPAVPGNGRGLETFASRALGICFFFFSYFTFILY